MPATHRAHGISNILHSVVSVNDAREKHTPSSLATAAAQGGSKEGKGGSRCLPLLAIFSFSFGVKCGQYVEEFYLCEKFVFFFAARHVVEKFAIWPRHVFGLLVWFGEELWLVLVKARRFVEVVVAYVEVSSL